MEIATFKTNLKAVLDATKVDAGDPATQEENYVNGIANAVQTLLLSCTIVYDTGLEAPGGPVTGDFVGGLE